MGREIKKVIRTVEKKITSKEGLAKDTMSDDWYHEDIMEADTQAIIRNLEEGDEVIGTHKCKLKQIFRRTFHICAAVDKNRFAL
jgi:hypothetical protein